MALPSSVTLGSVALIVAAGVGLVAVTSNADEPSANARPKTVHTKTDQPKTAVKHRDSAEKATHHKRRQQPDAVPKVFVEVYNNSGITGLAASKAAVLSGAGWTVAATDNWYGSIPENTVYYPAKLEDAAKRLAKLLHIARLRPAVSPMQFDRLTVIFTSA